MPIDLLALAAGPTIRHNAPQIRETTPSDARCEKRQVDSRNSPRGSEGVPERQQEKTPDRKKVRSDRQDDFLLGCAKIGINLTPDQATWIAFYDGNDFAGVAIYEKYTGVGGSVQVHFAGFRPAWITRWRLGLAFRYCFDQLQVTKIWGCVNSADKETLDIDKRIGWCETTRLEGYYPDGDQVIFEMTRDRCKWLTGKTDG